MCCIVMTKKLAVTAADSKQHCSLMLGACRGCVWQVGAYTRGMCVVQLPSAAAPDAIQAMSSTGLSTGISSRGSAEAG